MVEIKGFERACKMAEADHKIKEILADAKKRKINELVAQGISKEVAKVMVDVMADYQVH